MPIKAFSKDLIQTSDIKQSVNIRARLKAEKEICRLQCASSEQQRQGDSKVPRQNIVDKKNLFSVLA